MQAVYGREQFGRQLLVGLGPLHHPLLQIDDYVDDLVLGDALCDALCRGHDLGDVVRQFGNAVDVVRFALVQLGDDQLGNLLRCQHQ